MQRPADTTSDTSASAGGGFARPWLTPGAASGSRLFRKYAALLFALVASSLIANAAIQMVYAWRESRAAISAIQHEKARGAAAVIEQFIREIEGQVGWTTHANVLAGASGIDQRRFDFLRLLRQAPAVTEVTYVDPQGREQLKVSRLAMDVVGSGADYSADPRFVEAKAKRRHVSSVYFRKESEPYLTLSIAGQGRNVGVTIAEINLKFIWDVVSRIEVGRAGVAYVVDQGGHLIAHPDIGLVLRKTNMSGLAHVAAARARLASAADPIASGAAASSAPVPETALDRNGQEVLTASAPIRSLAWLVMVDQPLSEALAPVRGTFNRSLLVLLGGLGLAVAGGMWLARRMAVPINALAAGAERMGAGDLDHRIDVKTGDEVERLGLAFNAMGSRLKDSYAHLERKVEERTAELQESLEYQTAISDVLGIISRSPTKLQPVLDAIAQTAQTLCDSDRSTIWRYQAEAFQLAAVHDHDPQFAAYLAANPAETQPVSVSGLAVTTKRTVHVEDRLCDPRFGPNERTITGGARSILSAPLLRDGEPIGAVTLVRKTVRPFTPRQIALVETFANQAVIAIENARLFEAEQARTRELTESLEYQTATSEVLAVISKAPNELQPVLDTIARTSQRLCLADRCTVWRLKGGEFEVGAVSDQSPSATEYLKRNPVPADSSSIAGRCVVEKRTIHVDDRLNEPGFPALEQTRAVGARTMMSVPMLREGEPIGAVTLIRSKVEPFTQQQIALVETFADQAVIAIENARLFEAEQTRTKELQSALTQQTATADVLKAISRSAFDLQPVLDTLVKSAARLCSADHALIRQRRGEEFAIVATEGLNENQIAHFRSYSTKPGLGSVFGRAVLNRRTEHVPDLQADPQFERLDAPKAIGHRATLVVPLMREGNVVGVFSLMRIKPGPFSHSEIALVETFADQAVIAINNVGLFEEVQARTKELQESLEYQTATSEVLSVISRSPNELQPVLESIVATSSRLSDAEFAHIFMLEVGKYRLVATNQTDASIVQYLRDHPIDIDQAGSTTARALRARKPVHIPDTRADHEAHFGLISIGATRSSLSVPLLRYNEPIGAITLTRNVLRAYTQREIDLVTTFADQAVIAINNVGLFEEVQTRTRELQESLEYQTATSEVLRVISRSQNKFQPVLDSIAGIAAQLCNAFDATILLSEGSNLRIMAHHGPMNIDFSLLPLGRGSVSGRSVVDRSPIHVEDLMAAGADYPEGYVIARRHGHRTALAIPLLKEGDAVGCLFIRRTEVLPFTDRQISLLQTFADQAVIAIDNTRLFDELAEKNRQLELASQHKSQFLANMSHELRTPLNAILGYTELLADGTYGALAERPKGVLDRIDRNGKHLLGLINDVLDLSKIEAGEMQLALEDYALGSIVQNTITVTEPLARQKGLELKAAIEPNLPLGRGDARRLSQVLLNLVGNAIKFTDKGRIDVAATRDGERFRLTVRDTGPGIPEAEQAKIFEKFQQVDNTSTRRKGGSGLGLSISKELVEMHGGTISVVSAPGEGSTFEVVLPHRVCPTASKEAP